jgi:RNA methyltransferase, TrmH family
MLYLSSLENALVKEIVSLRTAKGRRKKGLFVAEGARTCQTLVERYCPQFIFMTETFLGQAPSYFIDREYIIVTEGVMKKMSNATMPSGLLCVFPIAESNVFPSSLSSGIVLENIHDPGNMGTLIRTAAAFKVAGVFVVGGVDVWSHKVVQATAGTIGHVPLMVTSWEVLCNYAREVGTSMHALVVEGGEKIENAACARSEPWLLVVGSESHGLSDRVMEQCDKKVTLAMPGGTESLNASVAGSIALYLYTQ